MGGGEKRNEEVWYVGGQKKKVGRERGRIYNGIRRRWMRKIGKKCILRVMKKIKKINIK